MNSYFGISLFFMVVIQKKSDVMQNWYLMWSANQTKNPKYMGLILGLDGKLQRS